jgi:MFS family permease
MKLSVVDRELYSRNISLNYIISSLVWGRFYIPVLALFYIASQVSLEDFAIISSAFALAILILEIPTGILADLLGKKKTLLLSRFMYIIEIFIIAFFNGFWPFLIAKLISGFGVSLASGTGSAFLYDTLKKLKREDEHKKISGNVYAISNIFMAVSFILGAYLFQINPKLPAYVSLPFSIGAFLLTFFLKEPYLPSKKLNVNNIISHFKQGIREFYSKSYLKYLACLNFIIISGVIIVMNLSSVYFTEILIPVSLIGIFSCIGMLIESYVSKKAHILEKMLGEKKSIILVQITFLLGCFLISKVLPYWGLLFILLFHFINGFYLVIQGDYINKRIKSSNRATILSINNMFDNIGVFLLFPIVGYLINAYSMKIALLSFAVFVLFYLFLVNSFYRIK